MQTPACRVIPFALCFLAAGCASQRQLPKYEKPLARAQYQTVRTTAYTHTEGDHLQYSNRNACGDRLMCGRLKSASCDWSRWPVGTMLRLQETGETYLVDDYGWALSGTNTIDLYKPSRSAMNAWGVRRVHIEILRWGDVKRSISILTPRSKHAHVRRMLADLRRRYDELTEPMALAATETSAPVTVAASNDTPPPVPRAVAATTRSTGGFTPAGTRPPLSPFAAGTVR